MLHSVVRVALGLAVLGVSSSCSKSSTKPTPDHIVEGVNLTQLFAPPTVAEMQSTIGMWQSRDANIIRWDERTRKVRTVAGTEVEVNVAWQLMNDGAQQFGAMITPTQADSGSLPILVYCHEGEDGVNLDFILSFLPDDLAPMLEEFVVVVPAFRDEPLTFDGVRYDSASSPSPWDRDVDDAFALLELAKAKMLTADTSRIGIVGFSRGATVGMLAAIRDPRIDAVVEFFGPTDFFGPFVQELTEDALQGNVRDITGIRYLNETVLQPLKTGALTIAEVRSELLRRSPVYFADRLPRLQIHHGTADQTVPVAEAQRLIDEMRDLGRDEPDFEYFIYVGGGHNLFLPGALGRTVAFLRRHLEPVRVVLHAGGRPSVPLRTGDESRPYESVLGGR